MAYITVKMADLEDYSSILLLQNENCLEKIAASDRKNGFLSAEMSYEQIGIIAGDLGIAVAYQSGEFLGFFCASRVMQWESDSIASHLIEYLNRDFPEITFNQETYCIFGPMCLTVAARGKGVLEKLYSFINASFGGKFSAAVGFISVENPRSLGAVAKLGWTPVGRFICRDREYHALIRKIA